MNQKKKIITCDIDGILTDYPSCWLKYLEKKCGNSYCTIEKAKHSEKNYGLYKDQYRKSQYKANLPVNSHNKNVLNRLAEKYDIIFATSRPINDLRYPDLYKNTYRWLCNNGLNFKELRYKDEHIDFINDIEVAFHIEDEIEWAKLIAKKMKVKGNGRVFLVTDKSVSDELEDNVIIVKDIQNVAVPFFSICIPSTDRGKTVYRALKSVAEQTFRDFELVIVDCSSTDNTLSEIQRFFASDDYKKNPFIYKFEKRNFRPKGTEDWNEPIKLATGKYIAMLEGDDFWLNDHLMNAFLAISKNPNIGIYGSSNSFRKRSFQGNLSNNKAKKYCFVMRDGVVPPSESIFIRCNRSEQLFLYNSDDYNYSPEIALYVDITQNGYDLFYSQKQDVFREPSTNPNKMTTWYYFSDRFTMIKKNAFLFDKKTVYKAKFYNTLLVMDYAYKINSIERRNNLLKNLLKEVGLGLFVYSLATFYRKAFFNKMFRFFNNKKNRN